MFNLDKHIDDAIRLGMGRALCANRKLKEDMYHKHEISIDDIYELTGFIIDVVSADDFDTKWIFLNDDDETIYKKFVKYLFSIPENECNVFTNEIKNKITCDTLAGEK